VVRDRDDKRTLWLCTASVCSGSALLGDLRVSTVSRSMERDLLSVLLIYPKIILRVFIVLYSFHSFIHSFIHSFAQNDKYK